MTLRRFSTDFLDEVIDEGVGLVQDEIINKTRWGIVHEMVFEADGELWMVICEQPATEETEVERWITDGQGAVTAHRVVAVTKPVTVYEKVGT